MDQLIQNVTDNLTALGITVATIALVLLGFKVMFSYFSEKGGGLRDAFSGVGIVLIGALLVGGGAALAGAFIDFGGQL